MNENKVTVLIDKLNTCMHRSENEETHVIKRCSCQGGDYTKTGYVCNKRGIFGVNQEICAPCEDYASK
jgi:hypothetical protein